MAVDLTISNRTSKIWFESTSRCNLRCVYCHMSHLDMPEHDIDFNGFDNLVQSMKERQVIEFIFNGRGENSFLDGWHKQISKVIESGINVSTVTNLSLAYSEEELETFSRFESITVSVDTTDYEVFRNIRRKASIHQVISNIIRIRSMALRQERKIPEIAWNMIMHTHSFQRVDQSVSDGLAAGVSRFQISVLGETEELPGALNPRQLDRLSREEFAAGCGKLFQAVGMIRKAGKSVNVSPGLLLLLNNIKRNYQITEIDFDHLPIG